MGIYKITASLAEGGYFTYIENMYMHIAIHNVYLKIVYTFFFITSPPFFEPSRLVSTSELVSGSANRSTCSPSGIYASVTYAFTVVYRTTFFYFRQYISSNSIIIYIHNFDIIPQICLKQRLFSHFYRKFQKNS